jgi:uncharacterized protein (UPF0216 family)
LTIGRGQLLKLLREKNKKLKKKDIKKNYKHFLNQLLLKQSLKVRYLSSKTNISMKLTIITKQNKKASIQNQYSVHTLSKVYVKKEIVVSSPMILLSKEKLKSVIYMKIQENRIPWIHGTKLNLM